MTGAHRQRIGAAFAAAHEYDRHARIQPRVAQRLAARIAALPLAADPAVLEIGCGTGHLTAALAAHNLGGRWLVTDLAPAMVERAQARLGPASRACFAVLDGEHGARPAQAPFDLVCSSLAFQWFADPAAAAARLMDWVAPGGWLALATLGEGTFSEWRAAHHTHGLEAGTPPLPAPAKLAGLFPGAHVYVENAVEPHAGARAFLRGLKAIGAATPAPGHRPLSPSALARVMATFEAGGAYATYQVVTILWQRPAP